MPAGASRQPLPEATLLPNRTNPEHPMASQPDLLTAEQVLQFKRDGVLVVPRFYPIDSIQTIQRGIYDIIGCVIKKHGFKDERKPFRPETFDDGFNDLILKDRSIGSEAYDAVKQIPEFIRLVSSDLHERLMLQLRPGSLPGVAAGGYGIRIDNPNEDHFRSQWHQEYPAQLRSRNGLVFWSSLVPITPELGPVEFCLGSHAEGILPVSSHSDDPKRKGRLQPHAPQ